MCGRTDGMDGRTHGRMHGRRQNYIPPTLSGDKKILFDLILYIPVNKFSVMLDGSS